MDTFHFLRPWWLLTLIPLVYLWPAWRKQWARTHTLKGLVAPHLLAVLVEPSKKQGKTFVWLAAACWVIASLAAAGPSWLRVQMPTYSLDYGRVILMDASLSTRANDVQPNRFEQLKFKAHDLLTQVSDGQTGLIAYAGDAFVVSPLTQDPGTIVHMLSALSPEIMPEHGHHPLMAFQQAQQLLSQAGYQKADIIWLTGGIDREQMEEIKQFIHQQPETQTYRVSVIAAGSQEGAPVRTLQGELLRDRQGRLIIPKLYPEYLQQITQLTGGRYFHTQADDSDIQTIIHELPQQADTQQASSPQDYDDWLDFGPYLALLLLPLLLLLATYLFGFNLTQKARSKSAHLLLLPTVFSFIHLGYAPSARALEQSEQIPVVSAFKNSQQRALALYQQGKFSAAARTTEQPMLTGMAYYRAGEYQQAATAFAELSSAEADFNRGNSLAKLGELEAAVKAYQDALTKQPNWQQAQENKALVETLLEQASEQQPGESNQEQSSENEQQVQNAEQNNNQEPSPNEQEQTESESTNSSPSPEQTKQEQNTSEAPDEQEQTQGYEGNEPHAEQQEESNQQQAEGTPAAWSDLNEEEREQLQSLLKQLDDDPAALLRTRLLREAERRRLKRHY